MKEYCFTNEGHTVGCLLRKKLMEKSNFAACVTKHPQDTNLYISLDCDDPDECLLETIREVQHNIQKILDAIAHIE